MKLDKDRQERIKELSGTFSQRELANIYGVSKNRIALILKPYTPEKKKEQNKRFFENLDKDPKRKNDFRNSQNSYRLMKYHGDKEFRDKVKKINQIARGKWLSKSENRKKDNERRRRNHTIKTSSYIIKFFRRFE